MKYIKKFENINIKKFWRISTDEIEFKLSLQILCELDINIKNAILEYNNILNLIRTHAPYNKIYLGIDDTIAPIQWNKNDKQGYNSFIELGYKYMGEIIVPDQLKNANKYNI